MTPVLFALVPAGIDDPAHPSGGNTYDRRVLDALADRDWDVRERPVPGAWPQPSPDDLDGLARRLADLPDGSLALVDGLIASAAADLLGPESARLRLVVVLHMPLNTDGERQVLRRAAAVVTTSRWTRQLLVERGDVDPTRVSVAEPGVDRVQPVAGSPTGGALLCVGVLAPHKAQDVLVEALSRIEDLAWCCTVVGALDVEPGFAARVRSAAATLNGRIRFRGPLVGPELAAAYATADLLVAPSRVESFGMVVCDALARGIPVIAGDVGGVPEALGHDPSGERPGLLVVPGDVAALAGALRAWLTDPGLRERLRTTAARRREGLTGWPITARRVSEALLEVAR
jgi:glycosyltransferase involved in cell wall biosynthesis